MFVVLQESAVRFQLSMEEQLSFSRETGGFCFGSNLGNKKPPMRVKLLNMAGFGFLSEE